MAVTREYVERQVSPVAPWYRRGSFIVLAGLALVVGVIGAGASSTTTAPTDVAGASTGEVALAAGDGHDHAEGEAHDHAEGDDHADHAAGDDHADHAEGDDHGDHAAGGGHGDHAAGAHGAHGAGDDHGDHAAGDDHGDHAAGDGHGDHAAGDGHGDHGTPGTPGHDHGTPGTPGHDHGTPGDGVTAAQKARAAALLAATEASLPRWATTEAAYRDGFRSINDSGTGYEHWVNFAWLDDGRTLDANYPESLVYRVLPGGGRVLESAMYILPLMSTMADIPDVGGSLTPWHIHTNLCWADVNGTLVVVGTTDRFGNCRTGFYFPTPPMLHVWIVDTPCGRFAEIEGAKAGDCSHASH